ncbi:MAG: hypothetical protein ACFFDT_30315 [Candidatus Hodarchaeota archaeon]
MKIDENRDICIKQSEPYIYNGMDQIAENKDKMKYFWDICDICQDRKIIYLREL